MERRTYLKSLFAAGAAAGLASGQKGAGKGEDKGIMLIVDMSVDPAKEKEMLHNFHTLFKPAAEKHPGYIDVNVYKLRSAVMGHAPAGMNYIFVLRMTSEEQRQHWINTPTHKRLWPTVENTLTTKDYTVLLFDMA
jgi:antibiotic biosynthesis monooxygenase (ABM) superfamily enzyme